MSDAVDTIRLICSGGRPPTHVIRELVILHRRCGRPDLAMAAAQSGIHEAAAGYLDFEPGWDTESGAVTQVGGDGSRSTKKKTNALVVPARGGGQNVHVPPCPDCGRGRGMRLPIDRLERAAPTFPGGIDISVISA